MLATGARCGRTCIPVALIHSKSLTNEELSISHTRYVLNLRPRNQINPYLLEPTTSAPYRHSHRHQVVEGSSAWRMRPEGLSRSEVLVGSLWSRRHHCGDS
ncbi:hypothetical protein PM082_006507 [Marasmius tenuissimus]|nr:hypothetical protein PM082_006507 [Marasmius tenuissimus]